MLKAKYYLSCNFLEARLGSLPSYTWQSIWQLGAFVGGLGRVTIFIVNVAWIPRTGNYKLSGNISNTGITKVSNLINNLTMTWKVEVAEDTFFEVYAR